MNSITIDNLQIGYGKKIIASGLSSTIRGGELTCLIGDNGTGKTTLLRTIAGFQRPMGGSITITTDARAYDLATVSRNVMSRLVSVVLTERTVISCMTVTDIVGMGRMPYTGFLGNQRKEDEQIVQDAMAEAGITALARRDFSTLSDGERQKAMIARALAQQTPVILLDEPTAFLDYTSTEDTMRMLKRLAHDKGKVVLMSTHDLLMVAREADRVLTIDGGYRLKNLSVSRWRYMRPTTT